MIFYEYIALLIYLYIHLDLFLKKNKDVHKRNIIAEAEVNPTELKKCFYENQGSFLEK